MLKFEVFHGKNIDTEKESERKKDIETEKEPESKRKKDIETEKRNRE